jgi:hypothetical protein
MANQRVDNIYGYLGIDRKKLKFPLSDEDRDSYAMRFHERHNPTDGYVAPLQENMYTIVLMKILKTLGASIKDEKAATNYMTRKLGLVISGLAPSEADDESGEDESAPAAAPSAPRPPETTPVIVTPGSREFRETEEDLRRRTPET